MKNQIEFILSHKCNQQCYYCNNYSNIGLTNINIDNILNLIKIVKQYNNSIDKVQLSGGEPTLIKNIVQLIDEIYKIDFVKVIEIMSNGLFRKTYKDILLQYNDKLICTEHPCLDFDNKHINYFYDDITFYNNDLDNVNQVIVLSKKTSINLLNNKGFIMFLNAFNDRRIKLKILTNKVFGLDDELVQIYSTIYNKLKYKSYFRDYEKYIVPRYNNINIEEQKKCSRNSALQFFDIEKNKIGQCSMNIETSELVDITKDNIIKSANGAMFINTNNCCNKCIKYIF